MKSKSPRFVNFILHILGFSLCILPPAVCVISYFPIWQNDGGRVIAGGVALLLTLCAFPIFKMFGRLLRSYASYLIWLILFLLFFSLSRIAEEMTVISFVGLCGNLMGAVCFKIGERAALEK
jgi:hypothetical protein